MHADVLDTRVAALRHMVGDAVPVRANAGSTAASSRPADGISRQTASLTLLACGNLPQWGEL